MFSLKRLTLALGGLLAALFGGGVGLQATPAPIQPGESLHDLQAKRSATSATLETEREARSDSRTPPAKPVFSSPDYSRATLLLCRWSVLESAAWVERRDDQRERLLVGTVELRI